MNKPLLIMLALVVTCAVGCKLDFPDFETTGTTPGSGTTSESYMPLTKGTYWTYLNVVGSAPADTATIKVTGGTQTINGRVYHAITTTSKANGTAEGFFYSANHIAALRQTVKTSTGTATLELQVVNDTTAVNHTWIAKITDSGLVNGIPGRLLGTVKERGSVKVVGGKSFSDVIHTEAQLQYDVGSGFETFTTYHYYVAKGIGLIQTDTEAFGSPIGKSALFNYTIK